MFVILSLFWIGVVVAIVNCVAKDLCSAGLSKKNAWATILGVVICGLIATFQTPRAATELPISDSVEYAVSAFRVVESGSPNPFHANLEIAGQELPSRYAPWFPTFVIAPCIAIASYLMPNTFGMIDPESIGWSVLPVSIAAILILLLQLGIMTRIAGVVAGLLAVLITSSLPGFFLLSRNLMIDIPFTLCAVLALRVAISLYQSPTRIWSWLVYGLVCAAATAIRVTGILFILPGIFILSFGLRRSVVNWSLALWRSAILGGPVVVFLAISAAYNIAVFGTPFRNGYNLWVAVPYDYLNLTFNMDFVYRNIVRLVSEASLLIMALVAAVPFLKRAQSSESANRLLVLWLFSGLPLLIFYLFYFWFDHRFYLTIQALLVPLVSLGMLSLIGGDRSKYTRTILWGLIAVVAVANLLSERPGIKRRLIDDLIVQAPLGAAVITAIDPVSLYPWIGRGAQARQIIPVSREVEFASKLLVWNPVSPLVPEAKDPLDHRAPGLIKGGAKEAVKRVALEMSAEELQKFQTETPSLYIDWNTFTEKERRSLAELLKRDSQRVRSQ